MSSIVYLFPVDNNRFSERWGNKYYAWGKVNEPVMKIAYYEKEKCTAEITIKTKKGLVLTQIKDTTDKGLNYYDYDLSINKDNIEEYKDLLNGKKKKIDFSTLKFLKELPKIKIR